MDYEQRYKKALDEAKVIHKTIRKDLKPVIEQIFPELKESEYEKIRKELIDYIKKKSENSCSPTPPKNTLINWITWLEKQTELESMSSWEPIDKIEPKFKVGDWVVTNWNDVVQIKIIEGSEYVLENGTRFTIDYVDKCWHLWTNQDIKDGDILCTYECGRPKIIFILKTAPKNPYILKYHCYYNIMYPYFEPNSETGCLAVNDGDLKPATKEQRDILFEKMKLEGYRWDEDEKKVVRFETFVRRKESDFAFKEDENGVIKFVHKKSKV